MARHAPWAFFSRGFLDAIPGLSGESLRIATEYPDGWEYLLFNSVLKDQLKISRATRRDAEVEKRLGAPRCSPRSRRVSQVGTGANRVPSSVRTITGETDKQGNP